MFFVTLWFEVNAVLLLLFTFAIIFDEWDHIDEIGMICVDIAKLYFDKISDHLLGFVQRF